MRLGGELHRKRVLHHWRHLRPRIGTGGSLDGSAWTREPTPANPPGSNVSLLAAVSCTSAASCTAVGASFYNSSPRVRTLAERWNGSSWTIQPTARPSGSIGYGLSGVCVHLLGQLHCRRRLQEA